jgi:hypothetical protein
MLLLAAEEAVAEETVTGVLAHKVLAVAAVVVVAMQLLEHWLFLLQQYM